MADRFCAREGSDWRKWTRGGRVRERVRMRKHKFGGGAEITCAPDNSVALQINFRPFKRDTCG